MEISKVSREDGIACAQLIRLITQARFDNITAKDAEILLVTRKWVQGLAVLLAKELESKPSVEAPASVEPVKLKRMGKTK